MLTPPTLSDDNIVACLHAHYDLDITRVTFLPLGADVNAAVYRIDVVDGMPYFLKLRRGDFDEVAVAAPTFLHAQGIRQVMAPIPTNTHRLWISEHGFDWILYPFFQSNNGFDVALSPRQWITLGQTMCAVHTTVLPADLAAQMPRENYSPHFRDIVKLFSTQVEHSTYNDPLARRLAAFWHTKSHEIHSIVERAEELGRVLQHQAIDFVVCHTDLHAGNVLLAGNDELAIVDWDNPILAPKERDLMFIGGGVGHIWNEAHEAAWFYQGYGPTAVDPVALGYYRYERIIEDLAAYGEQIFGSQGSVADREKALRVMEQFLPNNVVDIAHRTYQKLV